VDRVNDNSITMSGLQDVTEVSHPYMANRRLLGLVHGLTVLYVIYTGPITPRVGLLTSTVGVNLMYIVYI